MARIVITGADSGLGLALKERLDGQGHEVFDFVGDVRDTADCNDYAHELAEQEGTVDILINNAGINRIDYLENFSPADWDLVMDTNAKGIFNMTKSLLPFLSKSNINQGPFGAGGTVLNIVSNAAHMAMTSSLAYNASKAAAHIMTLQLARELMPRHGITVFGVAPNKLKGTGMSGYIEQRTCEVRGWTPEFAAEYQRKSLPAGEETDPLVLAGFISYLLRSKLHHKYLHGCIIPYGA